MIEVVSPETAKRDRGVKLDFYRRQEVAEYWIVDPDDEAVEVWRFGASGAEAAGSHERFTERLPVRSGDEVVGEIDLTEIFMREF